jgi:hypothetical protein
MNLDLLKKNLEANGFTYRYFPTAQEAGDYLCAQLHGKTIGIGGSMTIQKMGLYEKLSQDNQVYWHWMDHTPETLAKAAASQVYLTSVNAIAETGELINIDGTGNRVSAAMSVKDAVYFIAGVNKVAEDYDKALWRARNIASPLNARRLGRKTPCALKTDTLKCYDCKSPDRICNGLTVHWKAMGGAKESVVVLIGEELGY